MVFVAVYYADNLTIFNIYLSQIPPKVIFIQVQNITTLPMLCTFNGED